VPGDAAPILARASGDAHRDSRPGGVRARAAGVSEPLVVAGTAAAAPPPSVVEADDQLGVGVGVASSDHPRTGDCDRARRARAGTETRHVASHGELGARCDDRDISPRPR
jgi:hypothetical protein